MNNIIEAKSIMIKAIGFTLIDSLWQGLLVAFILYVLLFILKPKWSGLRYWLSMMALVTLFVLAGRSFNNHYQFLQSASFIESTENDLKPVENTALFELILFNDSGESSYLKRLVGGLYNNTNLIVFTWAMGILFFTLRLFGGLFQLKRITASSTAIGSNFWMDRVFTLSKEMNIRRIVHLRESSAINSPITIGYLKPMILLPVGILTTIPMEQLETIFIHELIHIKKADYLINLIQSLVEVLFFFHPGVWFISSCINSARENRCDMETLKYISDPFVYARAITSIYDLFPTKKQKYALSVQSRKGDLTMRIQKILGIKQQKNSMEKYIVAILLLLTSFGLLSFFPPINNEIADEIKPVMPGTATIISDTLPSQIEAIGDYDSSLITADTIQLSSHAKNGLDINLNGNVQVRKQNGFKAQSSKGVFTLETDPIYILNGQEVTEDEIDELDPDQLTIVYLTGERALHKYGEKAKAGVMEIQTRHYMIEKLRHGPMYAIDKQEVSKEVFYDFYFNDSIPKQTFFLEGKSATDKYGEKGKYNVIEAYTKTGISNIVDQSVKPGIDLSYPGKQPLILINEQEATMEEVRALDPSFISSINVLKGFGAAAKYGDKGKNGVVEITLNKSKSQLVILGRSMTQEPEYAKIIKSPEVLRVYPNPSADKMKIDISISLTNVVEISLFDLNGKVIRKFMASYLDPGNYNLELNTEGIPSGNYILMANTGSTILKEQVIINN